MACPLGVVLVGHGGAEQGHDPVSGELVDRTFIPVDLVHQDLEAAVHDLMGFLGIYFFG